MSKYILLFSLLLSSCGIFTNYRIITVVLPVNPPPWFMDDQNKKGKVLYPGNLGLIQSISIPWNNAFNLRLEKGSSIIIACYPSGSLKPAGAVINTNINAKTTIPLKWEDGFLADLLLDLKGLGIQTDQLNISRLKNGIKEKCNGNPWSLDRDLLKEAIIYNTLSVYKIKAGILQDIFIPVEGTWVSDNPFYPVSFSNSKGILVFNNIYEGQHRFLNSETKKHLDIIVKGDTFDYLFY